MKYKNHEYADIFPMMLPQQISDLAEDMQKNGQIDPIVIYEGKILDGRNRYAACQSIGIAPTVCDFNGPDALAFVLSHNLHRRHLDKSQLAMIAETVANLRHGEAGRGREIELSKDNSIQPDRKTRKQAAKELGVSEPSIDRARVVRKKGIPELIKAVEDGKMSVAKAAQIAAMPQDEQAEAIAEKKKPVQHEKKKRGPKPKSAIPTEDDIKREAERILGNLKSAWVAATTATRNEFLEWIEKNKNKTTA